MGTRRELFTSENLKKFERSWEDKIPVAFFRGTATGGGVTVETNQRLHLAQLSHDWGQRMGLEENNGENVVYSHLDAKITGWNLRDKKIASGRMTYIDKANFKFSGDKKTNFVPIYEQSRYKYVIYAEGHCAACRYGFMMQLGSVILKVDSKCVADQMWYFPLLQPYVDHVPVKADLSDLKEQIEWCRANDDTCRQIASNAKALYSRYISRDGILDYMQAIFVEISKRWIQKPSWLAEAPVPSAKPCLRFPTSGLYGQVRYCEVGLRRMMLSIVCI